MEFFRLIYVAASFLLLIVIYLINHSVTIGMLIGYFKIPTFGIDLPNIISYMVYLLIPVLVSWGITKRFKHLEDKFDITATQVDKVSPVGGNFLASFFAYIFLGLSINNFYILAVIYSALTIMCFCTQMYLYNPMFILFGYNYFYIKVSGGLNIILLTKKKFGLGDKGDLKGIRRLNDYTYIDLNL